MIFSRCLMVLAWGGLLACSQTPLLRLSQTPGTVAVALPPPGERGERPLVFRAEGLLAPPNVPVMVRVFAGHPAADASTPVEHESFLGRLTLLGARNPQPRNVTLPVPPELSRRWAGQSRVPVTLVPERAIPEPGLRVERLRFEVSAAK